MDNFSIVYILVAIALFVLSLVASFVIASVKISKNNANSVEKFINLNKTVSEIKSDLAIEIESINKEIISLKSDIASLPQKVTVDTQDTLSKMEKKLFELSDKLNVLDSTVKNIERMKDVEINDSSSPYYYADETVSDKANSFKDKVKSGYGKVMDIGAKIDLETAIKTAPAVVKAVKTILKK